MSNINYNSKLIKIIRIIKFKMDKRFKHTLVASKICPYCIKVLTFMYHKNLRFEVKFIEISNKPDWFLKISPLARVPILIIGEEGNIILLKNISCLI